MHGYPFKLNVGGCSSIVHVWAFTVSTCFQNFIFVGITPLRKLRVADLDGSVARPNYQGWRPQGRDLHVTKCVIKVWTRPCPGDAHSSEEDTIIAGVLPRVCY